MKCFHLRLYFYHNKISITINPETDYKTRGVDRYSKIQQRCNKLNSVAKYTVQMKNCMTNITLTTKTCLHEKEFIIPA